MPWGFCGEWSPSEWWCIPFVHSTTMGGVDWVLCDINSVSSRWRTLELGALWCAPSSRIGGHTKMAIVVGARMSFTYHVLTRPTLEYIWGMTSNPSMWTHTLPSPQRRSDLDTMLSSERICFSRMMGIVTHKSPKGLKTTL